MASLVSPKVYLVGHTGLHLTGLRAYLYDSDNVAFLDEVGAALSEGLPEMAVLCSFAAKVCYRALSLGHNVNLTRTRAIADNVKATFDSAHGSVFEHAQFTFVVANCSRVFTHELVRHRAGTAFSQTSGRYCRVEELDVVWDPILDPAKDVFLKAAAGIEDAVYLAECKLGLRKPPAEFPDMPAEAVRWVPDNSFDFEKRKKMTSAIRRIAPNGQANEIVFSANVRALRHMVQARTSRHAEREIRDVFGQVYAILKQDFPFVWHGARESAHEGLVEISGMVSQPYEQRPGDPANLAYYTDEELKRELDTRYDHARKPAVP
jgi:thymidylate synthase (FAD)